MKNKPASSLPPSLRARTVTAILGPTNTGKTHMAIERMLGHETGMIGLPLRLLAREIYNRIVQRIGAEKVALVTGEEKILPGTPAYWVCTVEAMPQDMEIDFVAIDEVQLASDLSRGHVFTDRILNMRGSSETLLLGAETARRLIEHLIPGVSIVTRPRLSTLSYTGSKKITRLAPRSAIIAFSTEDVYSIAELLRRQRGAAAVVLGALSPRTRNAQVELYQSGDVDYLVATDAVGMGLNLDVDHVAFANDQKFDGFQYRKLTPPEFAQVAGRAGRYTQDGTFGVTSGVMPFDEKLVTSLQNHQFAPLKMFQWRNANPDYASIRSLIASLDLPANEEGLTRAPMTDDTRALAFASQNSDVIAMADRAERIEMLWDVCQIPDYRKIAPANHGELIVNIFCDLARHGTVNEDWFNDQITYADKTTGDIDTLSNRIAHIRTWTYVANRSNWLKDKSFWQDRTREVEDRLSDALHACLLQRFVDRQTSVLMKRLREKDMLEAEIDSDGSVKVEGETVGMLAGFRFTPRNAAHDGDTKALRNAAEKALAVEYNSRTDRLYNADDGEILLSSGGALRWRGDEIARLRKSEDLLKPDLTILSDDILTVADRDRIKKRLKNWLDAQIKQHLQPLMNLREPGDLNGIARGIAFQLSEKLGSLPRQTIASDLKQLDQDERAKLRAFGVRFGNYHIFVPQLLKPAPARLLAEFWATSEPDQIEGLEEIHSLSLSGRTSIPCNRDIPETLYRIAGYAVCNKRAVRIDILERLADIIRPIMAWRPEAAGEKPAGATEKGSSFLVTVEMMSLLGCSGDDFAMVLKSLGYQMRRELAPPEEKTEKAETALEPVKIENTPDAEATASENPADETPSADADEATPQDASNINQTSSETNKTSADQPEATAQAQSAPAEDAEKANEPAYIEIWQYGGRTKRPDNQARKNQAPGQREPGSQHKFAKGNAGKPGNKGRNKNNTGSQKNAPRSKPNKERNERKPDPDSPFAALAALKDKLGK